MRPEWVGDNGTAPRPDERVVGARLDDFAYDATTSVLQAEPRLRTVAALVERAGPLDEALWREVAVLVAALLGPARRVPLLVAVTDETSRVMPVLAGEVTRLRFMCALRALAEPAVVR